MGLQKVKWQNKHLGYVTTYTVLKSEIIIPITENTRTKTN